MKLDFMSLLLKKKAIHEQDKSTQTLRKPFSNNINPNSIGGCGAKLIEMGISWVFNIVRSNVQIHLSPLFLLVTSLDSMNRQNGSVITGCKHVLD
jgi:hypothetical protein